MEIDKIKEKLKGKLKKNRYIHTLGVAKEARRLALIYGEDADKAYLAGLLHDCAKGYSIDEQIKLSKEYGVELDDNLLNSPPVIHGFLGVEIAKREYGVSDIEILNAIRYHTVGRAGMTVLEKIVYIADLTEENRDFDGVEELRENVDKDLDRTLILCLKQQFVVQGMRENTIHPNMVYMWNDLLIKNKDYCEK